MIYLAVIRTINVRVDRSNLVDVTLPSGAVTRLTISDPSASATSADNLVAYRPNYQDQHESEVGALFLNLDAIFPCIQPLPNPHYMPSCTRMTDDEDGFLGGRAILQAGDGGNVFRIFNIGSEAIRTYGIAFAGCTQLNGTCGLYEHMSINIVCLLPQDNC